MTVSPDEGMQLLHQKMAGQRAITAGSVPDPSVSAENVGDLQGGAGLAVMVRLAAALESNAAAQRAAMARSQAVWARAHLIEIPPGQLAAAGTLADPDRYGPHDGWAWRVTGITFTLLAGATSFSIWWDSPNDPTNLIYTSQVSGRWEPAHFYMMPGRTLVYTSVGGGLTVSKGNAFEYSIDAIPGVIGGK